MPKRGEIYWVDFNKDENVGSEQKNRRPALVISQDILNDSLPVVTVAAVTRTIKDKYDAATLILEAGNPLSDRSAVILFQVRTISNNRLENIAGKLNSLQIEELNRKMKNVWGL